MRAILIPPIPELHWAVGQDMHLLLPHLLNTPRYREFYIERRQLRDYLILDNGADEFGASINFEALLGLSASIGAAEIVLPDVQYDAQETVNRTAQALSWLLTDEGTHAWVTAGTPRFMLVPQGITYDGWEWCFRMLEAHSRDFLSRTPVEPPSNPFILGIPKNMDALIHGGTMRLLNRVASPQWEGRVHLLGWPKRLMTLEEVATRHRLLVRSVDSARPFACAAAGIDLSTPRALVSGSAERSASFFTDGIERQNVLARNVEVFRAYARGIS